jgi:hypothetical protein
MKRISRSVAFHRRIIPLLGLVVLLVVSVVAVSDTMNGRRPWSWSNLLFLLVVMAFGYAITWLQTSGLADEVLDAGDYLIVRIGPQAARVPIADIESVSESIFLYPGRVTVRLVRPCPFGRVITFMTAVDLSYLIPLVKSRAVEDLAERVERAQRGES